jgi:hypothetical protein
MWEIEEEKRDGKHIIGAIEIEWEIDRPNVGMKTNDWKVKENSNINTHTNTHKQNERNMYARDRERERERERERY